MAGSVTIDYVATDACGTTATCSATFTVPTPTPVTVSCPADETLAECSSQADIDAAWAAWVAQFTYSDGCDVTATDANGLYCTG